MDQPLVSTLFLKLNQIAKAILIFCVNPYGKSPNTIILI
jgi:hypothetical protein